MFQNRFGLGGQNPGINSIVCGFHMRGQCSRIQRKMQPRRRRDAEEDAEKESKEFSRRISLRLGVSAVAFNFSRQLPFRSDTQESGSSSIESPADRGSF